MEAEIEDYINVRKKLSELGCEEPSGFAVLPDNFDSAESKSDFQQVAEAATLKTLLRNEELPHDEILDPEERLGYRQDNALEWVAPTLFISSALIVENQAYVSVALNVVSNYATDFFKGMAGEKSVSMDIVVETSEEKEYRKISYEGPPEGIKDLDSVVEEVFNE